MSNEKKKITIEFEQTVKYHVEIEVSVDDFKMLVEADGSDVQQYIKDEGRIIGNPVYDLIQNYANDQYEYDNNGEFENFEILKYE